MPRVESIAAEQALLGSLLIDRTAWPRIVAIETADFSRHDHRLIFGAIGKLSEQGGAADAVTVGDYLERQGALSDAGGLAYLATLARDTPSAANVETYSVAVRERASLRRIQGIAEQTLRRLAEGEGSAAELAADVQDQLQRLQTYARTGKGLVHVRKLVGQLIDDLDRRSTGTIGLSIGLPDFDQLTYGLEPGDLVVIAARPSMGKTALLVNVASTVSANVCTAVFSAEMPSQQLMRRCVALQSDIAQGLLRRADKLTDEQWAQIAKATGEIAELRLLIDDTAAPALSHIRAEVIGLNAQQRLGLVLVDYVQLVRGAGANRYEQLRDVAYGLKALAKDLSVPIIVLAQLNRGVEAREHKRPNLSDLRDSGAIEEAADIVGLLYSEGYYDGTFGMPFVLECQIEKNRNGERGLCLWRFDGAHSRVTPLDDGARSQYRALLRKAQRRGGSDEL